MNYLIVGAGGVGGSIGGFLSLAGQHTTLIARGEHLEKMQADGLVLKSYYKGEATIKSIQLHTTTTYKEQADVIFVCVKGYDLEGIIPFIKGAMHEETIVIPLLNSFGIGDTIGKHIKKGYILDGCIYILSYIEAPGVVVQNDKIFKVVYGKRKNQKVPQYLLDAVTKDLTDTGIKVEVAEAIERETFKKFSFISSYAACGAYYDVEAYRMQVEGEVRNTLIKLQHEVKVVGEAMGIVFEEDLCRVNDAIVSKLAPDTTASLQKDLRSGKPAEVDSLIGLVVQFAQTYKVAVPTYERIWEKLKDNKLKDNKKG